jgi:hypothetical protein
MRNLVFALVLASVLAPVHSSALSIDVVRVMGPETRSPDGDSFSSAEPFRPRGDTVVVWAITEGDVWAAYQMGPDSVVPLIEDRPGDGYNGLAVRAVDEIGEAVYVATPTFPSVQSLYARRPGTFEPIAGGGQFGPGGERLGSFGDAALDGDDIAFIAGESSPTNVYALLGDTLELLADRSTVMPGLERSGFTFGGPTLSDGRVYFTGGKADLFEPQAGIYVSDGDQLSVLIDTRDAVPGRNDTFDGFGSPETDGARLLFSGFIRSPSGFPEFEGLYLLEDGALTTIADTATALPGDAGTFLFSSRYFLGEDFVLFGATGTDGVGIFLKQGDEIVELLGDGDELDLGVISYVYPGFDSLSGNSFSFVANAEGGRAIYLARIVPEPTTAVLIGAGLILLGTRTNRPIS